MKISLTMQVGDRVRHKRKRTIGTVERVTKTSALVMWDDGLGYRNWTRRRLLTRVPDVKGLINKLRKIVGV
jgi:hypothetical protein